MSEGGVPLHPTTMQPSKPSQRIERLRLRPKLGVRKFK